jgi:hypothetical protein
MWSLLTLYTSEKLAHRDCRLQDERMKEWKEQESTNWEWKWNWKFETKNKTQNTTPLFSENSRRKRKGTCLLYIVCASRRYFDQGDQKQGCGKCTKNVWRRWCRDINNIDVHNPAAAAAAAVQARFFVVTSSATDSIAFTHQGNEEIRRPTAALSLSLARSKLWRWPSQTERLLCLPATTEVRVS